jgi:hypothetical protein
MIRLGKAAEPRHIQHLYYLPDMFTAALELNRFGIEVDKLSCSHELPSNSYIAVNARARARNKDGCFGWTRDRRPMLGVGDHVWIYKTGNEHKAKNKSKAKPKKKLKPKRR